MRFLTRLLAAATVAAVVVTVAPASAPAEPSSPAPAPPRTVGLPDGFQPEGIATSGATAFVGSLADGDIYAADLRTGRGRVISQGPGRPAAGLDVGPQGRLYVSGADSGRVRIVDTVSGRTLRELRVARGSTFVNDVVVTGGAAWFTDSSKPRLYRVPIYPDGHLPRLRDVRVVRLGGGWEQPEPGAFGANGIETLPGGGGLVVVNSTSGDLYRVVRGSGRATRIRTLGPALTNGDGLLRQDRILYVVRNQLNRVAVLRLGPDAGRARQVDVIASPRFDVPTTIAPALGGLYLPNARFTTPPGPDVAYDVNRVTR